ncbi:MAG: TIR domain-containing protein [Deltaproteobacteria bacterium]|nr:TIR domain-containing protein [Deltaproteobacteria bacterium]
MMNFKFSIFISYRQNDGDKKFLRNFKKLIECEAQKVTNEKVFFDEDSIDWGKEFDDKIYESIVASYFFIPIYHFGYLHVDNIWCARELYHALEVEKIIRDKIDNKNHCYILPVIFRGNKNELPCCIRKKKAKEIRQLEALITSNKTSNGLIKFKNYIYDTFLSNYKILYFGNINLKELCTQIHIPTDEEIRKWIKEQNEGIKKVQSTKIPRLKKNEE